MKSLFKKIVVAALSHEARAVIRKHKPTIIAITGSVGKTSTKDATYHILASSGVFVRKSEKSFNSEFGVPLTILGLKNAWNRPIGWIHNIFTGLAEAYPLLGSGVRAPYPKCLVLEVGADHPGDIKNLTKWLTPDIAVVTAVSKIPVHVEFFVSPEEVLQEKLALPRGVRAHGKVVLPASDPFILAVRADIPTVSCLTFAVNAEADVTASLPEIMYAEKNGREYPTGMSFTLKYLSENASVSITDVIGAQHIYSIAAAGAAALSYGVKFADVVASLSKYEPPRGRMNLLEGIVGSTIIDDTYNASPDAVREALNVLGSIKAKADTTTRKIAVLGDMMELGTFSPEEHRKAGERASQNSDMLVTVGIRARDIAEGAAAAGMSRASIHSFDTSVEAGEWLRAFLQKESIVSGDQNQVSQSTIILVKGSQSSRMERVSYALLADQARAADLLVRQDPEWLAKK